MNGCLVWEGIGHLNHSRLTELGVGLTIVSIGDANFFVNSSLPKNAKTVYITAQNDRLERIY